jgi:ankyrin repeat protein
MILNTIRTDINKIFCTSTLLKKILCYLTIPGCNKIVKYLLRLGANMFIQVNNELILKNFMSCSYFLNDHVIGVIKVMIDHDENILNIPAWYDMNILLCFLHCRYMKKEINPYLLDDLICYVLPRTDINYTGSDEKNILHYILAWDVPLKYIQELIDYGCDVNKKNIYGNTPLSSHCRHGGKNIDVIKIFMENLNFDPTIRDENNKTFYYYLTTEQKKQIAHFYPIWTPEKHWQLKNPNGSDIIYTMMMLNTIDGNLVRIIPREIMYLLFGWLF